MIINKLTFIRRFTFALIMMLISVNLWGQELPTLSLQDPSAAYNADTNPYVVTSAEDWGKLASDVAGGYSYSEKVIKLTANITVSEMVGVLDYYDVEKNKPFSGTFDGNNDTLTFNKGTDGEPFEDYFCAPFRCTDGALIQNLTVNGTINTSSGTMSGLIGYNDFTTARNTVVDSVVVCVNLICTEEWYYAEGGCFAVYGEDISFSNCVYNGYISAFNYNGGFCGKGNDNTSLSNCVFYPTMGSVVWGHNFVYYDKRDDYSWWPGSEPDIDFETCYYTMATSSSVAYGDTLSTQGQKVFVDEVPADEIGYYLTEIMGYKIYKPVVVADNVQNKYDYNDGAVVLTIDAVSVTFDGVDAISNGYCVDSIFNSSGEHVTSVSEVGGYTLKITGTEDGTHYFGSVLKTFYVIEAIPSNWYVLQDLLNGEEATIEIDRDYEANDKDVALSISRDVVINLNNHTIDRNLTDSVVGGWVLKVNKGAKVTINGPGIITGGFNKETTTSNDGGGIHNMGNLTLNDVTVTANKCVKKVYGSTAFSARGGGIYSGNGSTFVMNGGTINHNFARGGGGGIFIDKATSCTMNGVDISGNECLDKGGGIRITGNATLINCTIRNNELKTKDVSDGGGVYYGGDGTLRMTGCRITGNQATKQGGGLHVLSGTVRLKNCEIVDNFAFDYDNIGNNNYGGGICLYGGQVYMDSVVVAGNISREDGCGIYVRESGAKLHLTGYINIFNNFKTETIGSHGENNNVYLANTSSKLDIQKGFDALSYIGVIKNGPSDFTTGLGTNGSIANFASDKGDLYVVPAGGEAKMAELKPFTGGENVTVSGPMVIDDRDEAASTNEITISGDGILYIVNSGYVDAVIHNEKDETRLIIEDGGQVVIQEDPVDPKPVPATIKKDIEDGIWYLISSAVATPRIVDSTNMVTEQSTGFPSYDLYRFNEGATTLDTLGRVLQWENYRAGHADFTELTSGRGYLYRNYYDYTIIIDGNLNTGNVDSYVLSYNENLYYDEGTHDNIFKGFNIIGNPYPHNIKKGEGQAITNDYLEANYYTLLENGTWKLSTDDVDTIRPMTGILVQAKSGTDGQRLTMYDVKLTTPTPEESKSGDKSVKNNIWFTIANSKYEDRACVEFREGHGLCGIQRRPRLEQDSTRKRERPDALHSPQRRGLRFG